jgi:hypothetical protein
MTARVLPQPAQSHPNGPLGIQRVVTFALAAWFLLVVAVGAAGAFVATPGKPPVAIAIGVTAPLVLFWALLRLSQSFREFVLSLDLRLIAGMQAWRWAGLGFLSLYAHDVLPAMFALPAGLGDMAVGVTAPWMILALARRPEFATSAAFIRWNLLGILDLVVAIILGTLGALLATGSPGEVSTAPMATLPLLLIPAFLVPFFLILHATTLLQIRRLTLAARIG